MKNNLQEEVPSIEDNIQPNPVPVKRKRGRPPSKNKNLNKISENLSAEKKPELVYPKISREESRLAFQYPPQIQFPSFNFDQKMEGSSISTPFFIDLINRILELWWNGSSPVLYDDSNIIKYEIIFNMFKFIKKMFVTVPPFLIITAPDHANQWVSSFIDYDSYLYSDNEKNFNSDLFYTNNSKKNLDVLILSHVQNLSNFALKNFSILILDQPPNFDNFSSYANFGVASNLLISTSAIENVPNLYDVEHSITVTTADLKSHHFISETIHFCPMTQLQHMQTQQLYKTNKRGLSLISRTPAERKTSFLSRMVQQAKSISVHPSLSSRYSMSDDQSGKFQEMLKVIRFLQASENKISIIGHDTKLMTTLESFLLKNDINPYKVNQTLKGKKRSQNIEDFNQSDSSSVLLIDPENFSEFNRELVIDKIIIIEVEINLVAMIDAVINWQKNQHDNRPQIIRFVTDNSIELPILEMMFKLSHEEDTQKLPVVVDFDSLKSDLLMLLLQQSAFLCFESDPNIVKPPVELCYSSRRQLFNITREFPQNFWDDVTENKNEIRRFQKTDLKTRSAAAADDNSSIATRVKRELKRRAASRKETEEEEQNNIKYLTKVRKQTKSKVRKGKNEFRDEEEEAQNDEEPRKKKRIPNKGKIKIRQSPRQKPKRKYTNLDSGSDESENDESDESEEEDDYDNGDEKQYEDDENEDEEEEEEASENESQKTFVQSDNEEEEADENESIATRSKRRLKKKKLILEKAKLRSKSPKLKKKSERTQKVGKRSPKKAEAEKTVQQPAAQQQKPRKHIPKFVAMVNYWNLSHFTRYLELLHEFGFERWDKFSSFERPIQELRKIGALIVRNLETTSRENRILREYFKNELRSSELSRLDLALPFVRRKLAKSVDRTETLADLTGMLVVNTLAPDSPADIVIPKIREDVKPPDNEWTDEDDKNLLFVIYKNGLLNVPSIKHYQSRTLIKRFRSLFSIDPSNQGGFNPTKAKPAQAESKAASTSNKKEVGMAKGKVRQVDSYYSHTSHNATATAAATNAANSKSTKSGRIIGLKQHAAIIHNLCSFGYPNLRDFRAQMGNMGNISDSDIQEYVENVFKFSTSNNKEERKALSQRLAGKIEKYTAMKIISRKQMFEKLRTDAESFDTISAEDIELLSAMSFHGFSNTETSPVLLCSCSGECSDQRLCQRVKAIAVEDQIHDDSSIPSFMIANDLRKEETNSDQESPNAEEQNNNSSENINSTENANLSENQTESLFPLKLNDRQVLKEIGSIDPQFHNEKYVYPIGYESAFVFTNPFNDIQNQIWLNASVRLDNDQLLFVVRKENEKSLEIKDGTPDGVFEKVRQRLLKRSCNWIPPIDGHEMFGFNSAKFHRILAEMPRIEECDQYRHRFFRMPMTIEHKWPVIGHYEDKKKMMQMYTKFASGEANKNHNFGAAAKSGLANVKKSQKEKNFLRKKEKSQSALMKKKEFGNLVKPLVINCSPLFNADEKNAAVSVSGSSISFLDLVERYEKWDEDAIQKYLSNND